ncbi:MAG: hypothetical protein AAF485_06155 [Chloroflexota bacterium]
MEKKEIANVFDAFTASTQQQPRLAPKTRETIDLAQHTNYDTIVDSSRGITLGPDGALPGPFNAWMYVAPELTKALDGMGNAINEFIENVPDRIKEMTICQVAAHTKNDFIFWEHSRKAKQYGVSGATLDALRTYQYPPFENTEEGQGERAIYRLTMEALQVNRVSDDTYDKALEALGSEQAMVELTFIIGHYANLAAQLNILRVPAPGDSQIFA